MPAETVDHYTLVLHLGGGYAVGSYAGVCLVCSRWQWEREFVRLSDGQLMLICLPCQGLVQEQIERAKRNVRVVTPRN